MKTTQTHYVYKITNNNPTDERKYYIGVKSSLDPENDNYWGSSDSLKESITELGLNNFSKEILSTWESREEANAEEIRLHKLFNVSSNPEYYNKAEATSTGFCTFGYVTVLDVRDGKTKSVSKDDFEKFDYYVSITHGHTIVVDTRDGKTKKINVKDFEKFDYYVSIIKGTTTVIDNRDGLTKSVSIEDFGKFDHYIGL